MMRVHVRDDVMVRHTRCCWMVMTCDVRVIVSVRIAAHVVSVMPYDVMQAWSVTWHVVMYVHVMVIHVM